MIEQLARLDGDDALRARLLPFCRLKPGEIWVDPDGRHRVGVIDAADPAAVARLLNGASASLAIADPPYNVAVGARNTRSLPRVDAGDYESFSRRWVDAALAAMAPAASFYVWLGADCRNGFHPFPEFCQIMRAHADWTARNWITLRNQRGYGTQKNWMWVRQELLYYARGAAPFDVQADYTEIPKAVRGYYKTVNGARTENLERGRSSTIRAGNVWIDIQQVFYRREENVPGCYAQKPLKAIERIVLASSAPGDTILDPFCHSGTVLAAGEMLGRRVATGDIDPIFAEIAIRRLERLRTTGKTGWQWRSPFPELNEDGSTACAG